ncbi:hypothetical protein B9W62_30725 [Streptomyces sp. CS113]|nr:hypothetical protein B9W62_30725 [Streptomyces sp. CS113]
MSLTAGWVAWPGACGVPPRPPVPPQRHDCPRRGRAAAAYGGKGTCRGVFARSGWRVNAAHLCSRPIPRRSEDEHPPARPRPTTERTAHRAPRTPTEPAQAPQASRAPPPPPQAPQASATGPG